MVRLRKYIVGNTSSDAGGCEIRKRRPLNEIETFQLCTRKKWRKLVIEPFCTPNRRLLGELWLTNVLLLYTKDCLSWIQMGRFVIDYQLWILGCQAISAKKIFGYICWFYCNLNKDIKANFFQMSPYLVSFLLFSANVSCYQEDIDLMGKS